VCVEGSGGAQCFLFASGLSYKVAQIYVEPGLIIIAMGTRGSPRVIIEQRCADVEVASQAFSPASGREIPHSKLEVHWRATPRETLRCPVQIAAAGSSPF